MIRIISEKEKEEIKELCWNHIEEILIKYRNRHLITYTDRILLNTEIETLKMLEGLPTELTIAKEQKNDRYYNI